MPIVYTYINAFTSILNEVKNIIYSEMYSHIDKCIFPMLFEVLLE